MLFSECKNVDERTLINDARRKLTPTPALVSFIIRSSPDASQGCQVLAEKEKYV